MAWSEPACRDWFSRRWHCFRFGGGDRHSVWNDPAINEHQASGSEAVDCVGQVGRITGKPAMVVPVPQHRRLQRGRKRGKLRASAALVCGSRVSPLALNRGPLPDPVRHDGVNGGLLFDDEFSKEWHGLLFAALLPFQRRSLAVGDVVFCAMVPPKSHVASAPQAFSARRRRCCGSCALSRRRVARVLRSTAVQALNGLRRIGSQLCRVGRSASNR